MSENLNYETPTGGSYCYNDKEDSCDIYGRLYTWSAAVTACPDGWHLPNNAEWDSLMVAVGGVYVDYGSWGYWEKAGEKLKSETGWNYDGNGNDAHGFSALPGGVRLSDGSFGSVGNGGYWWSATEYDTDTARNRYMDYFNSYVFEDFNLKSNGYSVRCLRD